MGDPTKTCPECAEAVQGAARVCRYCGFRFAEPVSAGGPVDSQPPPGAPSRKAPGEKKESRRRSVVLLGGVVLLVVGAVALLGVAGVGSSGTRSSSPPRLSLADARAVRVATADVDRYCGAARLPASQYVRAVDQYTQAGMLLDGDTENLIRIYRASPNARYMNRGLAMTMREVLSDIISRLDPDMCDDLISVYGGLVSGTGDRQPASKAGPMRRRLETELGIAATA